MLFELRHVAGLRKYVPGAKNTRGNPVPDWLPAEQYKVFGWVPIASTEPDVAGHDHVVIDVKLSAPSTFPAGPRDKVVLDGLEYEVIGYPENYSHGQSDWDPGILVNLHRVEG
ncbi:hypothetical protein [Prescottella agglutinans]|uniref:Head-to-tail stopper n=1 Tax=Prescottella agglutinans TaxID=1644129 RepID=A0ABT6MG70_9NOCA|nr:hypothetical protein [Prescottella agglutinans]MDH6283225.1 hypothetical protein [Prescottella agglutinans]